MKKGTLDEYAGRKAYHIGRRCKERYATGKCTEDLEDVDLKDRQNHRYREGKASNLCNLYVVLSSYEIT